MWLLLAPRDYLSTFVKLGVVMMLAVGILFVRPELQLPAFTRFTDGTGPIFAGKIFPFCFITIACGAISGFHSLISSGTTPKMIAKESHAWPVGYGSMLLESFVAIMAMIAACVLQPGVYFAVNSPAGIVGATPAAAVATISGWGFPVTRGRHDDAGAERGRADAVLAHRRRAFAGAGDGAHFRQLGRRPGGDRLLVSLRDHVRGAVHPDDYRRGHARGALHAAGSAGPRVGAAGAHQLDAGRDRDQRRRWWARWGYFLVQGVRDPLGGINSLWPLFGISNQLLASIALCVATTILLKMHGAKYMWITCAPMVWLVSATFTAAWQKIFSPLPAIGFLAQADKLEAALQAGNAADAAATRTLIFNARLDAAICGVFMVLVAVILVDSIRVWAGILSGNGDRRVHEAPFVVSRLQAEEL